MSQMVKPAVDATASEYEKMSEAEKALYDAQNASGATMEQNAVYMQSLEAATKALHTEFEKFVLGKGGLQDFAKNCVNLGTFIIKLINNLGGLKTVLITLLSLSFISHLKNIEKSLTTLKTNIIAVKNAFVAAKTGTMTFDDALKKNKATITATELAVGALTTALTVAFIAYGAWTTHIEKQRAALESDNQAITEHLTKMTNMLDTVKDESTDKDKLIEINKELNDSYDDEAARLKDINDLRKETTDLIEEEAKQKADEYISLHTVEKEEAEKRLNTILGEQLGIVTKSRNTWVAYAKGVAQSTGLIGDLVLKFSGANDSLNGINKKINEIYQLKPEEAVTELTKRINELTKQRELNGKLTKEEEELLKEYVSIQGTVTEQVARDTATVNAFQEALEASSQGLEIRLTKLREIAEKNHTTTELTIEQQKELMEKYGIEEDAIEALIKANEELGLSRSEAIQLLAEEAKNSQQLAETYEELTKATSKLESEISSLATALTEQENNGSIALKTQLELIDAGYAAALAYDEETGACKLNEEAVQALVEAKIRERIASLEAARASLVEHLKAEAQAALTAAGAFLELAKAKNVANEASLQGAAGGRGRAGDDPSKSYAGFGGNGGYLKEVSDATVESNEEVQKLDTQIKALEGSLKQIQNVGVKAFGTIGKSSAKAGKSAKSAADSTKKASDEAKDAADAAKEAEEAEKKAIEEATKAIQSQINALDEEIAQIEKLTEAIEKEKTALENTQSQYEQVFSFITKKIEEQIQALEDEKDAAVEASQAIVDAKKAEKEATVETYEAIIEAKEAEKDATLDQIEEEIALLKEAKEAREKYWDEEIDALKAKNKEYKESLELQEKLDALEKAKNTKVKVYKKGQGFVYDVDQTEVQKAQKELDEYLKEKEYEEHLEELEKLKNAEIENYNDRIDELTKFKDNTEKNYEKQITDLKNYVKELEKQYDLEIANLEENTKALEAEYDEQIKIYEGYKSEFETMVNAYQNSQDELLASQLTGINFENNNWMTRISNLQSFVDEYTSRIKEIERLNQEEMELNEKKAKLAEEREALQRRLNETKNGDGDYSTSSSNSSSSSDSSSSSSNNGGGEIDLATGEISYGGNSTKSNGSGEINLAGNTDTTANWRDQGGIGSSDSSQVSSESLDYNRSKGSNATSNQSPSTKNSGNEGYSTKAKQKAGIISKDIGRVGYGYASGIGKVDADEIAVVGENPNKEVIVGSKLNNGELFSLSKGSGVVNSRGTNTLAEILNQIGKFGTSQFGRGGGTLNNNTNNESLIINGVTIQGANISDPQSFVNGLLSLKAEALQRAYKAH